MQLSNWTSNLTSYRSAVEEVLRGASYRKCDSIEARNAIAERLRFPGRGVLLCQYRPCDENAIKALQWGSILFKSPLKFNDPFDSLMFWDQGRIERYFREEPFKSVLEKFYLFDATAVARKISNCLRVSCLYEKAQNRRVWVRQVEVDYQSRDYALKVGEPLRGV